jgi:hypothetical protein
VPRAQHPWGHFKIGSWKQVRTVTENLNDKGQVASTSITETTTKLVDIDDAGYTLRIDAVVEVAGKRFSAPPQVVRRGFNGENDGEQVSVKQVGETGLTINGRKIACQVRQLTVAGQAGKRITTVHYSEQHAPYVLKRETTALDSAGKPTDVQCQVDVVAVDMPFKFKERTWSSSTVRVMNQQGKTSTLTLEVHCAEVPGGVVSHTSKDTDENGRVLRRSTLDLLDYGIGTGDDEDARVVRKVYRTRNRRR